VKNNLTVDSNSDILYKSIFLLIYGMGNVIRVDFSAAKGKSQVSTNKPNIRVANLLTSNGVNEKINEIRTILV
jgi:hypothetical protein